MQGLNSIINQKNNNCTTDNWELNSKPIVQLSIVQNTPKKNIVNDEKMVDAILEQLSDLITPSFKPWFAREFYKIPRERIMILASQARADAKTTPARLFSYLIKLETQK